MLAVMWLIVRAYNVAKLVKCLYIGCTFDPSEFVGLLCTNALILLICALALIYCLYKIVLHKKNDTRLNVNKHIVVVLLLLICTQVGSVVGQAIAMHES